MLFADMRGYTPLAEREAPEDVARLLNRFYALAIDVLSDHDAVIDKLVGDEVMALFLPGLTRQRQREQAVSAAEELLRGVGYGSAGGQWLRLGVGVDFGVAFVGNVGSREVKDFTAVGDVVNTAARLQSQAREGQIVMSAPVYETVAARFAEASRVELDLKGKSEPVPAYVVDLTKADSAA